MEWLAVVLTVVVAWLGVNGFPKRGRHLRGSRIDRRVPRQRPGEGRPLVWGRSRLSPREARQHFLALGSTGSGKTLLLSLLMKSMAKRLVRPASDTRLLAYDGKTDLLPMLAGSLREAGETQPETRMRILNPYDRRAFAWDMAADIRDPFHADDLAAFLIPKTDGEKNVYFVQTAQRLLGGIIEAFLHRGVYWIFRDVLLASKTKERLQCLLGSCPETEDLLEHFHATETFHNVKSTLDSYLRGYRGIAAVWHRALLEGRRFTIGDWLTSSQVLVLGNHPKAQKPIKRLNALLFSQIAKAILSEPARSTAEHGFVLDEFRELGRLDFMTELMTTGRSKGLSVALGFQDIAGLDAAYGRNTAREIIGCCQNLALLHLNASQPDTQLWASKVLGQEETERLHYGRSTSRNLNQGFSSSLSTSYRREVRKVWLPSQFATELPPASAANGLTSLVRSGNRFAKHHIPGPELFSCEATHPFAVPREDPAFPAIIDHPQTQRFTLGDWHADDLERLKLPQHLLATASQEAAEEENVLAGIAS